MKIVFMGTPEFALPCLRALVEDGHEIVGVVTQTDKPRGRGYVLTPPPVKEYALSVGLPVYQPKTLRDEAFSALLAELDPELIVVVAFGKILPANVLDYPRFGCINVHGSLLPEYRGAAPMQRAIIEGRTVTGVTTMFMDVGLDTGDMLLREEVGIGPEDNFENVHDNLAAAGARTLRKTLAALADGTLVRQKQSDEGATYAAKIEKADTVLDFSCPAKVLHDQIRGTSPFPLSYTRMPDGKLLKIVRATVNGLPALTVSGDTCPGTVLPDPTRSGRLFVACGEGSVLEILTVLPEGKGRMSAADFLRGRKLNAGDVLGGDA